MKLNNLNYEELDKSFITLLQSKKPKSVSTLKDNTLRIVQAYNNYLFDLAEYSKSVSNPTSLDELKTRFELIQNKLTRLYELIECPLRVKNNFEPLNLIFFIDLVYPDFNMTDATLKSISDVLQTLALNKT